MSVEVMPIGYACNLHCAYCYQKYSRSVVAERYDEERMFRTAQAIGKEFTTFGGEPLLVPFNILERVWKINKEKFGRNGIQTNGILATDQHFEAFKKYGVHVGISMDGPYPLNAPRCGIEETAKAQATFDRLLKEKLPCSLILTVHSKNAAMDRLPMLVRWLIGLGERGLRDMRVHLLERDSCEELVLQDEELLDALFDIREACVEGGIRLDLFRDISALLRGNDRRVTCIWNGCDPWSTSAVQHVDGQGQVLNCGRTYKDGKTWLRGQQHNSIRQLTLLNTPQKHGGCEGCEFFIFCKGFCPGHARDWRERPPECKVIHRLFEIVEKELCLLGDVPITKRSDFEAIQRKMYVGWTNHRLMQVWNALEELHGRDRTVRPQRGGHGDIPHGDSYADHWD